MSRVYKYVIIVFSFVVLSGHCHAFTRAVSAKLVKPLVNSSSFLQRTTALLKIYEGTSMGDGIHKKAIDGIVAPLVSAYGIGTVMGIDDLGKYSYGQFTLGDLAKVNSAYNIGLEEFPPEFSAFFYGDEVDFMKLVNILRFNFAIAVMGVHSDDVVAKGLFYISFLKCLLDLPYWFVYKKQSFVMVNNKSSFMGFYMMLKAIDSATRMPQSLEIKKTFESFRKINRIMMSGTLLEKGDEDIIREFRNDLIKNLSAALIHYWNVRGDFPEDQQFKLRTLMEACVEKTAGIFVRLGLVEKSEVLVMLETPGVWLESLGDSAGPLQPSRILSLKFTGNPRKF